MACTPSISPTGSPAIRTARLQNSPPPASIYPNALTTAPSDSFPGMIAQVTGATPKTAGLFYDDSYDRTVFPSALFYTSQGLADPGCTGAPGTEVTNFEALDKSFDPATGLIADVDRRRHPGQGADAVEPQGDAAPPRRRRVQADPPHQYLRTNTVFEVIKQSGGLTAWSDKHPAYEILNGPSGKGIDDLFTPGNQLADLPRRCAGGQGQHHELRRGPRL